MSRDIIKGMADAYWREAGGLPATEHDLDCMRAAVMWLADNISDDMVLKFNVGTERRPARVTLGGERHLVVKDNIKQILLEAIDPKGVEREKARNERIKTGTFNTKWWRSTSV